jgi:capsular polysaccharide biosynthesis protein
MEEISLREVIEVVLKRKWFIAVVTAACILLAGAGSLFLKSASQTAQVYISLNFDGIGNGLNPDGTKFDSNLIKSPAVVQKALDALQLDNTKLSVDKIRRNITIDPMVPEDIVAKIESLREKGQDFTYYPNEFTIKFTVPKGVDGTTGGRILDAVVDAYSDYFYDVYSDKSVLSNSIGKLDYSEYDYPEISTVIRNQISIMTNYLTSKVKESKDFRAKQTGLAFADIIDSIGVISSVDINRMDSIIGAYNLTKDKDKLITSYEYRIKMNDLERAKRVDEAAQSKDMMNNYKRQENIMLIPGMGTTDTNNPQLQDNTSYYDTLTQRATDAGVDATNRLHDNEYLTQEIEKLKTDTVEISQKQAAEKEVLALCDNIRAKIQNWIDLANETAAEYYEVKLNKAIMRLSPVQVQSSVKVVLNVAAALVIGLILGIFIAFFREYWMNSGKEKKPVQL